MPLIPVHDADDPRLAPYVSIRERDLTGRGDGRFIVEGKVTLGILAARSRFAIESVFIGESRVAPLSGMLESLPQALPVYVAPQALMDTVAGFAIHRGVLACARKGEPLGLERMFGADTLLVLNDISNHDNVGAAFRNAAAFGAGGVILDEGSCDPLYRKAIRVSAGSALWLPFHHGGTGQDHVRALKQAGYAVWTMTPRSDATPLPGMAVPDRVAVLLGAEGQGLPDGLIAAAHPVRIPMAEGFDSVNVATAGAIALARIFERRRG
jgi:tRNA G18 (ribose-2'-O)-methylase SpoU